jgi:hypothetical protein
MTAPILWHPANMADCDFNPANMADCDFNRAALHPADPIKCHAST